MLKHKTEGKRVKLKLKAVRDEAWRFMRVPLAPNMTGTQRCSAATTATHNYCALNGFYQGIRRIWLRCLRRCNQKSWQMGWDEFETLMSRFPLPLPRISRSWAQARL